MSRSACFHCALPVDPRDTYFVEIDGQQQPGATRRGERVVAVHPAVQGFRRGRDRLHCVTGAKTRWSAGLPGYVMSPVLAEKRVVYLTTAPRATSSSVQGRLLWAVAAAATSC